MIDSRYQLGMTVKRLRANQRLTQVQLGMMIGRDRSYISRIERGRCNITFDTILLLSSGLNVSPSELLAGIGESAEGRGPSPVALSGPRRPLR